MSELRTEDWDARTRRIRDVATVLPAAALALLLPPLILVFAVPVLLFGIPLIVVYLFGVWAVLIVIAMQVARRLERAERDDTGEHGVR